MRTERTCMCEDIQEIISLGICEWMDCTLLYTYKMDKLHCMMVCSKNFESMTIDDDFDEYKIVPGSEDGGRQRISTTRVSSSQVSSTYLQGTERSQPFPARAWPNIANFAP